MKTLLLLLALLTQLSTLAWEFGSGKRQNRDDRFRLLRRAAINRPSGTKHCLRTATSQKYQEGGKNYRIKLCL